MPARLGIWDEQHPCQWGCWVSAGMLLSRAPCSSFLGHTWIYRTLYLYSDLFCEDTPRPINKPDSASSKVGFRSIAGKGWCVGRKAAVRDTSSKTGFRRNGMKWQDLSSLQVCLRQICTQPHWLKDCPARFQPLASHHVVSCCSEP